MIVIFYLNTINVNLYIYILIIKSFCTLLVIYQLNLGQKLSKKELQHTTIIKKLRAKEDEMEKTIKSQA